MAAGEDRLRKLKQYLETKECDPSWSRSTKNAVRVQSRKYILKAYSFEGLLIFSLLVICTSSYIRRVPRLKQWLLTERKGLFGIFYKASVIGTRLHLPVALACTFMGMYILLIR